MAISDRSAKGFYESRSDRAVIVNISASMQTVGVKLSELSIMGRTSKDETDVNQNIFQFFLQNLKNEAKNLA
jgi:hypothetical protein